MTKCKLCEKSFKVLNNAHLRSVHKINTELYKILFGEDSAVFTWNKGKTKETDKRVAANVKDNKNVKRFTPVETEFIKECYVSNIMTPKELARKFSCSVNPIKRVLKQHGVHRTCAEARKLVAASKREYVSHYTHNGKRLKVVSGYVVNGSLTVDSVLQLRCSFCEQVFERTFHCYKLSIDNHKGTVLCARCGSTSIEGESAVPSSSQQRRLALLLGGDLNYRIGNIYVDVALLRHKIAIEYDGWYWHNEKQHKDRRRDEFLKQRGWKILRIKGGHTHPDIALVNQRIKELREQRKCYAEIVLDDWVEGHRSK